MAGFEAPNDSQEALTLKGHINWVWSVAFSPDGKRIVSGSNDRTLKVWDAAPLGVDAVPARRRWSATVWFCGG